MAILYFRKQTPSKAKADVDVLLNGLGARNIGYNPTATTGKAKDFIYTLAAVGKARFAIRKGDVLVLQYNFRKYYGHMCRLAHRRGAKVVTLVHDLGSFYRSHLSPDEEIARLSGSDYLIVHNERMKSWLVEHGCKVPIGTNEIFDYLSETTPPAAAAPQKPYRVIYAGTLGPKKNGFLYQLEDYINSYRFVLYGGGFDPGAITKPGCFEYLGFMPSDKLVADPGGDFGLVWDGSSIDACEGPRGEYMRWNNPHKFSLYLRCGLPVIIWKEAAMSRVIEDHGVGLSVGSLKELDAVLENITPEQYAQMQANARAMGDRLGDGFYFKRALLEALAAVGYPDADKIV